ncbi:hypothetical protein F8M41_018137 [Gigaspora margarita]|uniref:Uncharacterized protein n=1 Tax=Gigaspora margarita TaxID=4874 RepID=A0A8H4AM75_GIGMA|nr:hypothetical protein F8M41_018137 [Gigaspora margarita]
MSPKPFRKNYCKNYKNRTYMNRKVVDDLKRKAASLEREYLLLSLEINSLKRENSIIESLQQSLLPPTGTLPAL